MFLYESLIEDKPVNGKPTSINSGPRSYISFRNGFLFRLQYPSDFSPSIYKPILIPLQSWSYKQQFTVFARSVRKPN